MAMSRVLNLGGDIGDDLRKLGLAVGRLPSANTRTGV